MLAITMTCSEATAAPGIGAKLRCCETLGIASTDLCPLPTTIPAFRLAVVEPTRISSDTKPLSANDISGRPGSFRTSSDPNVSYRSSTAWVARWRCCCASRYPQPAACGTPAVVTANRLVTAWRGRVGLPRDSAYGLAAIAAGTARRRPTPGVDAPCSGRRHNLQRETHSPRRCLRARSRGARTG